MKHQRIFGPFLSQSIWIRPYQLYKKYGEVLYSDPEFQQANIYFIVENSKIRFVLKKTRLQKDGLLASVFLVSNKKQIKCTVAPPEIYWGRFKPKVLGVKDQHHYLKLLPKHKFPFCGISIDWQESTEDELNLMIHTPEGIKRLPILAHKFFSDLKLQTGNYPKILYIGQSKQIAQRTSSHEKIQRVLAEHNNSETDIYLYFFTFTDERLILAATEDDITELKDNHLKDIDDQGKLNLVEMALINYFKPRYNSVYVDTAIPTNKQVEKLLITNGFTKIMLSVNFDNEFLWFGSDYASPQKHHDILFELSEDQIGFDID